MQGSRGQRKGKWVLMGMGISSWDHEKFKNFNICYSRFNMNKKESVNWKIEKIIQNASQRRKVTENMTVSDMEDSEKAWHTSN